MCRYVYRREHILGQNALKRSTKRQGFGTGNRDTIIEDKFLRLVYRKRVRSVSSATIVQIL